MNTYRLKYSGLTDIGMKRTQNQDHLMCVPELALFIVADGMGGHKGGETASLIAVTAICDYVRERKDVNIAPEELLTKAIQEANRAIYSHAAKNPELTGMGTTCTTLFFHKNKLFIGHVGDSRAYMIHPGCIWQLTKDHSLVQEKLRAGMITREQLKTDRMKNVITRSVGYESQIEVDIYEMKVQPGDSFLMCSDGLSGMCDDPDIMETVSDLLYKQKKVEETVKTLIAAANQNGGDDNITSILINVC